MNCTLGQPQSGSPHTEMSGMLLVSLFRTEFRDFPGGPLVKNQPCNAGDAGAIPGRGAKSPHAAGQLSPRATTTQPACLN